MAAEGMGAMNCVICKRRLTKAEYESWVPGYPFPKCPQCVVVENLQTDLASLRAQLAAAEERARKNEDRVSELETQMHLLGQEYGASETEVERLQGVIDERCSDCARLSESLAAARSDAVREFAAEYNQEVTARSADGFCRVRPLTEWADAWIVAERGGK